jgi:rod shape determining protein RodA
VQYWHWKGLRPLRGWRAAIDLRVPWQRMDWHVLVLAGLLVGTSLFFVRALADADLAFGRDQVRFAPHLRKVLVALPFVAVGLFLRPRWLRRSAFLLYGLAMILLLLLPLVGEERNNARSWIPLPLGFDLQPSELAKIGLILALARALYRNRLEEWRDWRLSGALALAPMALVMTQPDLGTTLTIVPVALGMAWLAGAPRRALGAIVAAGFLAGWLGWQGGLVQSYQKKRVETWAACLDNDALVHNQNGAAFHVYQARVAIGNGGLFGRGLGRGVAAEAGHLPERSSDSIFAVIAEQAGFLGASAFVGVYLLLASCLVLAAGRLRERFARLVVGGVGQYFAAHFFINAGVNLGLLPMTGLTLPLVSTGGSSMLASFLALGLALGLCARAEPALDSDSFRG